MVLCVATLSLQDHIEVILDEQKYEAVQYTYLSVLFCLHCVFLATYVTLMFDVQQSVETAVQALHELNHRQRKKRVRATP